jgi:hypothetical protein
MYINDNFRFKLEKYSGTGKNNGENSKIGFDSLNFVNNSVFIYSYEIYAVPRYSYEL